MPSRVSNERLLEFQKELGNINTRLESYRAIEKERSGSKLWEKLGPRIKGGQDAAQSDVNRFVSEGDLGKAQMAYGALIFARGILGEVDGAEANIERLEGRRAEIRATIKRAKEHDGVLD